jgi:hypothetical protein
MTALERLADRLALDALDALAPGRAELLEEVLRAMRDHEAALGLARHELADQRIVAGELVTRAGQLLRHPHARRELLVQIAAAALLLAEALAGARPDLPTPEEMEVLRARRLDRRLGGDEE